MKSKHQDKIYGILKNKICGFLLQSTYNYYLTFKIVCLRMKSFSQNSHLWAIPSHINMIQNKTRIQNSKFKPTMFHVQSLS